MKNFWNFHRANFKPRPFFYSITFLLLPLLFFSQGCKKEINSIGLDLKDPNDLLNAVFTDTVSLSAYSVFEEPLNTTGLIFNYLGCMKDPVFGSTTASFFTQLVPANNGFKVGDSYKLDSIVLTLRYTGGFYGDTLNPFVINVYELTEKIQSDSIYYQNHSIKYDEANPLKSNFILYPKPNSKVKVDTLLDAHLRIKLNDELGNRFLDKAKNNEIGTEDAFKNYFKGLYISAEPFRNGGCLVNFSLTSALTGIQLYYTENGKAQKFSFIVKNPDAVRFSKYEHNYNAGDPHFVAQIDSLKSDNERAMLGKEKLYVQAMGGIKTKIEFPNIKALNEINSGRIVINKAELVITNIGDNLEKYPNPSRLFIQAVNLEGKPVTIMDALTGNGNYFGGSFNKTKSEYRFRITRHIQDLITKNNYLPYIYLVTEGAAAYPNRLILQGTDTSKVARLRLEVYYTEY